MTLAPIEDACPVPLELLGSLYRSNLDGVPGLVEGIPEARRAQIAVYLYGRSHTNELGIRLAATCTAGALEHAGGRLGAVIYAQSRQPYARPSYGDARSGARPKVSLGGSRCAGAAA